MCEQTEDCHAWLGPLVTKVSPNLGKDFENVRCVTVASNLFNNSNLFFVNIVSNTSPVDDDEGKKRAQSTNILVKKMPAEALQEMMRSREQFHNEILFYQKFAQYYDRVPRCIYATEEPSPLDSVIVLENVATERGYSVCKWKYDTPMEYTLAAFREIARFHAIAYATKRTREKEFFDFVNAIEEVRNQETSFRQMLNGTATRSLDFLRRQGHDKEFCDKLEARMANTFEDLALKFMVVEEPLSTLCHGDFTINNMLFKKESDELKVIFVDFALIRYGSPILDLSMFLCMHCARDLDKVMLDNLLRVYHDSLIQCLKENDIDGGDYSYEALYEDYKKRGLFGFFIATFFLAMQMGKFDGEMEEFAKTDQTEWTALARQIGGEEVDEILANMLLKLKEFGCLDYIL